MSEQEKIKKLKEKLAYQMSYWHQVAKNESGQDTPERWSARADSLLRTILSDLYIDTGELTNAEVSRVDIILSNLAKLTKDEAEEFSNRAREKHAISLKIRLPGYYYSQQEKC